MKTLLIYAVNAGLIFLIAWFAYSNSQLKSKIDFLEKDLEKTQSTLIELYFKHKAVDSDKSEALSMIEGGGDAVEKFNNINRTLK